MAGSEAPGRDHWRALNLAWWDERAPLHEQSQFYRSGGGGLEEFEIEDLRPLAGSNVIHPQCHIGTDTISLVEHGADTALGLDFSAKAIEGAGRLAEQVGVADRTEWVTSDVYDAVAAVDGRTFDLVYTGKGALCWIPDMVAWAEVMWNLLRPGGTFYLSEFHPLKDILSWETLDFDRSYFATGGAVYDDAEGSYADRDAVTANNTVVDFLHPLSEIMQALLDQGFVFERFREFPFCVYQRWPFLEEREPGVWWMPAGVPEIPLMYSLRAHRPG